MIRDEPLRRIQKSTQVGTFTRVELPARLGTLNRVHILRQKDASKASQRTRIYDIFNDIGSHTSRPRAHELC